MLLEYNAGKDGKTAVTLRITKNRKRKYIKTDLLATPEQWNTANDRFVTDKKLVPKYKEYNTKLSEIETRVNALFRDFEVDGINWTLNQFEVAFVGENFERQCERLFQYNDNYIERNGTFGYFCLL